MTRETITPDPSTSPIWLVTMPDGARHYIGAPAWVQHLNFAEDPDLAQGETRRLTDAERLALPSDTEIEWSSNHWVKP